MSAPDPSVIAREGEAAELKTKTGRSDQPAVVVAVEPLPSAPIGTGVRLAAAPGARAKRRSAVPDPRFSTAKREAVTDALADLIIACLERRFARQKSQEDEENDG